MNDTLWAAVRSRGWALIPFVLRLLAAQGQTRVVHNYETIPGAIPIHATLSLDLGKVISEQQTNIAYRFVSDYPFQDRAPHQLDEFERQALAALAKQQPAGGATG